MQKLIISLIALFMMLFQEKHSEQLPDISSSMKLNWKAPIGCASFRTNVVLNGDDLFIGSNGDQFRDYYPIDKKSGLYRLNRKSGNISNRIGNGDFGDLDVNGVLIYKNRLYFGNDNEEFLCTTKEGKILWQLPTSADVEHEPSLINNKGKIEIVYATELGEVRAVDPENGKTIWEYYTEDFRGWMPGKNRITAKVGAFISNTENFYTRPVLADINKDGVEDLIYNTYNWQIIAIDGANGKQLWLNKDNAGRIFITNIGTSTYPLFACFDYEYITSSSYKCHIKTINKQGKQEKKYTSTEGAFRESGINTMKCTNGNTLILSSDSIYILDVKGEKINSILIDTNSRKDRYYYYSDVIFGTDIFKYKGHEDCIVLLHEYDENYSKGFIEIISLKEEKTIEKISLPEKSEMAPVIADINKDGQKDILLNCYDGYLYCYTIPSY